MTKNFSEQFDTIYEWYSVIARESGTIPSNLSFSRFLNHEHDGRVRAWKRGQWPSAEDIWDIHQKMGFSLGWLVSGEGEPFAEHGPDTRPHTPEAGAEARVSRVEQLEREIAQRTKELAQTVDERDKLLRELLDVQRENMMLLRERAAGKRDLGEQDGKDSFLMEARAVYGTKTFHESLGEYGDEKEKPR